MDNLPTNRSFKDRAIFGLKEGALNGVFVGLIWGFLRILRSDHPWYLEFFGSWLLLTLVCSVVFAIGRGISNRLLGACIGAISGLFTGLFLGDTLVDYTWSTTENSDGSITATGSSPGQPIGMLIGLITGALTGAIVHRVVSHRMYPENSTNSKQGGAAQAATRSESE